MKPKKLTAKEKREIKFLSLKALNLWRAVVKKNALIQEGKKLIPRCQVWGCKKIKRLNAHHIESFSVNKGLRYEPLNGVLLCTSHHKFGRLSAHRSFFFTYDLLYNQLYHYRWNYLICHYQDKVDITKDFLLKQIDKLEKELGIKGSRLKRNK